MKKFNRKVFTTASIIAGLLVVISMFSELEADSGQVGSNTAMVFLSALFKVLRFPSHTILGSSADNNTLLFAGGLILNCLFYGLLYERIHTFIRGRRAADGDQG